MSGAGLSIRDLVVTYPGARSAAVTGVSLSVEPGRTLALVGPSGAGKSTVLRAVCGLVRATSGEMTFDGVSMLDLPPQARRAAMVFAVDALVRTMSVRENLHFAVRGGDARGASEEIAGALGVAEHLDRRPAMLSTGERQRVSIARAVLSEPRLLLLDEPLAPLDPDLRIRVRDEIVHVRERFAGPILMVTHDHTDAMAVADDLAVLIDGRIEDAGDPQRVYDRPATLGTARFLGARPMNVVDGVPFGWNGFIGFRPERARLGRGALRGTVVRVERTGADAFVHVRAGAEIVLVRVAPDRIPDRGAEVSIEIAPSDCCRYDRDTGRLVA